MAKNTSFADYCKAYSKWKLRERKQGSLTNTEIQNLRESYKSIKQSPAGIAMGRTTTAKTGRLTESQRQEIRARIKEAREVSGSALTRSTAADKTSRAPKLTEAQKTKIRQRVKEAFAGQKDMGRAPAKREGVASPKFTGVAKVASRIREARSAIFTAKRALRENDMMGAAEGIQQAGDAVNAVDAAVQLPPDITTSIQNIKAQIDELATKAGIQSPVDLGANPEAGLPPVEGAAPAGPGPMLESKSSDQMAAIRERIAARRKSLAKYKEGTGAQHIGSNVVNSLMVDKFKDPARDGFGVSKTADAPTQIPEIPEKKVAAGTAKGVVRWPNKPIAEPNAPTNVDKEFSRRKPKLSESLDEVHVSKYLDREKLDFKAIYKNGLLG